METEFKFDLKRHDEKTEAVRKAPKPSTKNDETSAPRFWMKEMLIPERVCRKLDPHTFLLEFVQPFMQEFAKAISTARMTGRDMKVVSYVRFPQYIKGGVSEKGKENSEVIQEAEPNDPGSGAIAVPGRPDA